MKSFHKLPWFGASVFACWIGLSALSAQSEPFDGTETAQWEKNNLSIRAVTFQVPSATALLTLDASIHDDAELFNQLTDMVEAGTAEIVGDQSLAIRSGQRTKVEAVSELIYPTEWQPFPETRLLPPTALETRQVGDILGTEAFARADAPIIDLSVSLESVRWKRNEPVPILIGRGKTWAEGLILQPLFVTRKIITALTSIKGAPVLTAIMPAGDVYDGGVPTDQGARLIFVLAQKAGRSLPKAYTDAPRAKMSFPLRLHTLGFRMPSETVARWLAEPAANEAAWLDQALALVREGQAALIHHAACLTRSGQRCRVTAVAELIHRPAFEMTTLDTRYVGGVVEFEPVIGADGHTLDVAISLEETGRPRLDSLAMTGQAEHLRLPVFPKTQWVTALTAPLGAVRLLGAAGAAPDVAVDGRAPGTIDVYFLKSAGVSRDSTTVSENTDPQAARVLRVTASLYSLNADEAAAAQLALENLEDQGLVAQEIAARWEEGHCPLVTQAVLTTRSGQRAKIESGTDRVLGASFKADKEKSWERQQAHPRCAGLTLEVTPTSDVGDRHATLTLECAYDAAPARLPSTVRPLDLGNKALEPGFDFAATEYLETFTLTEEESFADGETRLVAVQPSRAPFGPEAGRWHALVVRVDFR